MLRNFVAALAWTLLIISPTSAQTLAPAGQSVQSAASGVPTEYRTKRRVLGYGRLTSNDLIGDGRDRWRTGSVTMSRVRGYSWFGAAPEQFGELLETRIQGQILAPENLVRVSPTDRPHSGTLSAGIHTHFNRGVVEYALGINLVAIGPQTRLDNLQSGLHGLIDKPEPSAGVLALQISNQFRPTFVAEIGRKFQIGRNVDVRPFAELRAGDETMARFGADFTIGAVTQGELLARESVTGQRYRLIYRSSPGVSFVVGGDVAFVTSSIYLPRSRGFQLTDRRNRARAGLHWQGERASVFYGLTYLGREFQAQSESQVLGSIRVKLRF